MSTLQLVDKNLTPLAFSNTVAEALQWEQHHNATHVPVVTDEKFEGLISVQTLDLHMQKLDTLKSLESELLPASVSGYAHFLKAVSISNLYKSNIIPVVNDGEYMGSIIELDLIHALGNFCGAEEYGALIVLEIDRQKLALSEINSIMESDGATILHFNASPITATPLLEVTIGLDKKELSTIIANLEQYQYKVLWYSGDDLMENELKDNYQNLMNYLDI